MNENEILKIWNEYEEYRGNKKDYNNGWNYANSILYEMCKSGLAECSKEVIAGRLLIIGRTYAAALERNSRIPDELKKDTYELYSCVAELDVWETISSVLKGIDPSDKDLIINTHYKVVEAIRKIGTNNKVSLVSKFLHFHWDNLFFIYDEQARQAINLLMPGEETLSERLNELKWKDYAVFYYKVSSLRDIINTQNHLQLTPREIDDFLLYVNKEKVENRST